MVAAAKKTMAAGYQAIKTDPYKRQRDPNPAFKGASMVERLTPRAIAEAVDWMDALREAVGPDYELMVDAHARFDVASAISGARPLEHINLVWFEEPTNVESNDALRQVRENVRVPLCIGERHFTRWDYVPVLQQRLVDYIMPDVAWCGGISELRRIAALAEPYYIRVSPHDALGPVAIAASFQVCMTTPNLYREECLHTWFDVFKKIITPMFDVRDGCIFPSGRPGLGIELVHEEVARYAVDVDSERAKPYWWTGRRAAQGRWLKADERTGARPRARHSVSARRSRK
jgi:galactonate dehydratase